MTEPVDLAAALARVTADRDRLRAALEWLVHLDSGVGKAGDAPEADEWVAAIEAGRAALSDTGRASPPQQEKK